MKKFWVNHYRMFTSKKGNIRRYDVHIVKKDGSRGKILATFDDSNEMGRMDFEDVHSNICDSIKEKFDWKWWPGILKEKVW